MRENRFFILSADLSGRVPVLASGAKAVLDYAYLTERLEALCGRDAASLFAEPVLPRSADDSATTISWYGPFEGRPVELDSIDEVARRPVADRLAARLRALAPALADRELGPLVAAGLSLPSNKDILILGGEPLLVNWGHLPAEAANDPARRAAHFLATLGRFAPDLAPLLAEASGRAHPESAAGPGSAPAPPSPAPGPIPGRAPILVTAREARKDPAPRRAWRAPMVATLAAAGTLLALLLPGVLAYPDVDRDAANDAFEAERLKKSNESLEAQLKALQNADRERVCRADGRNTIPVPGLPPTDPGKPEPAPRMEILPRPPERVPLAPPRAGEPPQASTVADLLEKTAVYIAAPRRSDKPDTVEWSSGTGFFVSDRHIVTNHHVVQHVADEQQVYVAGRSFGGVRRARVIAKTQPPPSADSAEADFAVLDVEPIQGVSILKLGPPPPKLSTAYLAGFPGFLIEADSAFEKFKRDLIEIWSGRLDDEALAARRVTVPGVDLRFGRVNNTMTSGPTELPIIIHDMQIAPGNSGGPLVDACGRLGGVNTFQISPAGPKAQSNHQQGNVAQSVSALRKFLEETQISFSADDGPCDGPSPATAPPGPK